MSTKMRKMNNWNKICKINHNNNYYLNHRIKIKRLKAIIKIWNLKRWVCKKLQNYHENNYNNLLIKSNSGYRALTLVNHNKTKSYRKIKIPKITNLIKILISIKMIHK